MEEKSAENIVSTQKKLPSTHNPGWNDPPSWAFNPAQSPPTTTKRTLNKRIAFPLSSVQSPVQNDKNQFVSSNLAADSNCTEKNAQANFATTEQDKDQIWLSVTTNLENAMSIHKIAANNKMEIEKKLSVLKTEWFDNKLNDIIHKKIINISNALKEGNITEAEKIHFELVVNHGNLCKSWINSMKNIIDMIKTSVHNQDSCLIDSKTIQ